MFWPRPLFKVTVCDLEAVASQIYTQVSIRKLKEIHTATHPGRLRQLRCGTQEAVQTPVGSEPTAQDVLAALAAEAFEDD